MIQAAIEAERLTSEGRYAEAVPIFRSMVEMGERRLGADHPLVAQSRLNLFPVLWYVGRYVEAESEARQAVDVFRQAGPAYQGGLARALGLLASARDTLGYFDEAEQLYMEALALQQTAMFASRADVAELNNNLATFYAAVLRYQEAERLLLDNIALRQSMLAPDHPEVAVSQANLGALYVETGRYGEALDLLEQAAAVLSAVPGRPHTQLGIVLGYLAEVQRRLGNPAEAEETARRGVAALTAAFGENHLRTATILHKLALAIADQGRYAEAAAIHERAIAIHEATLGPNHVWVADGLQLLAGTLREMGQLDGARKALERALVIQVAGSGLDRQTGREPLGELSEALSPEIAVTLHGLATIAALDGDLDAAEAYLEPALSILARRFRLQAFNADASTAAERRMMREIFLSNVDLMARLDDRDGQARDDRVATAFEGLQWAHVSRAGDTVARIARALAQDQDGTWEVIRERETTLEYLNRVDQQIAEYLGRAPEDRDRETLEAMRDRRDAFRARLEALDGQLPSPQDSTADGDVPDTIRDYADPTPVSLALTQSLLADDEALLAYGFGDSGHLVVVRSDAAAAFVLPISADELDRAVAALRLGLDPSDRRLRAFDVAEANGVFERILQPAMAFLDGIDHLIMVPDGALESLPAAVLVMEPYDAGGRLRGRDYQRVAWLGRSFATTALPSVRAFVELRRTDRTASAEHPFLGITGPDNAWLHDGRQPGPDSDPAFVRWFTLASPLDDLGAATGIARDLAGIFGVSEDSIIDGDAIREDRFYRWAQGLEPAPDQAVPALSAARVVAFVTHGFVRGEFGGNDEPALLLGFPEDTGAGRNADDAPMAWTLDGLLSASEVLSLPLNADWVLLTACNSAAGEGSPGAEQLSGLARAFFHAGAQQLLVSHWPVHNAAAPELIRVMFAAMRGGADPAEALRTAMSAYIDSNPAAMTSHPAFWAPFTIVGAGT